MPCCSANFLNAISMSYSTSTWSHTNPIGWMNTPACPCCFQPQDRLLHRRTQPRPARHALALKCKAPLAISQAQLLVPPARPSPALVSRRDRLPRSCAGNTVRGKDHRNLRSSFTARPFPARFAISRRTPDQQRIVVPLLDEIDREGRFPCFSQQRLSIESDAGSRILRSQADRYRARHAVRRHLLHRVGDEGLPVAHADVHGNSKLSAHSSA